MKINDKLDLIKRNTVEILGQKELEKKLKKGKKLTVYLGTAITGSPHVAYFTWAIKLSDFVKAGCKVKLLLADVHGALDNTPWDVLEKRYKYYKEVLPLVFEALGVGKTKIEFVRGSDYQLSKKFSFDLLKLSSFVSVHDSTKAASEVVKMGKTPKLSGILYPLLQALDEEYLKVDIQYGGIDQRKIFVLAMESLPKIGYEKRIHIMTPLLAGLTGDKMSASDLKSKIDFLDSEEEVRGKIKAAVCEAGNPKNGLMDFLKYVVFVIKGDKSEKLAIERDNKYGGDVFYESYDDLEKDFIEKKVHPLDLKHAVAREVNLLLTGIRKKEKELRKLWKVAYS